jgi:Tol biopolymer transport system component
MQEATDLRGIFERALSLPPQDRMSFLDDVCGGREDLRRDVERLLAADTEWADLFDTGCSLASTGPSTRAESAAALPGELGAGSRLGRYEILETLGSGGMGHVYRATDTRLGRSVAIKVLRPGTGAGADAARRFEREAQAAAALSHPHICSLFDVGRQEAADYLVMECLEGETLAARLARGRLPRDEALRYAAQIADALAAAHRHGIVHRDLKPGNIMLTASGAKLLDFGLAARRSAGSPPAGSAHVSGQAGDASQLAGTLPYMAPEQLRGLAVDERTDVFAFGAVLYEMLAGRRAFDGASPSLVAFRILQVDPPPLSATDASTPAWLDTFVRTCLDKVPADRWASFEEIRERFAAAGRHRPLRRWLVAGVAAAAALAAAGAGLVGRRATPGVLTVTSIQRLTHDRVFKDLPYTDGTHVFYIAWGPGFRDTTLHRVPLGGGESVPVATPFKRPYVLDLLPGRGELLAVDRAQQPAVLHRLSYVDGRTQPIGTISAGFVDMAPDNRRLVFAERNRLFVASSDGSGVRLLISAHDNLVLPRWSPDGRRIRYTVDTSGTGRVWEVSGDGGEAHEVLPGWSASVGAWMPDGRFFVFEAERDGEYGLWAVADGGPSRVRGRAPVPVKLTSGPMRFENAVPSPDGRVILALGTPPSTGELVRWDAKARQFVATLGGPSASDVTFSRDGRWIAYVRHPDRTLWRSRPDGREQRQLTSSGTAGAPSWSPDGGRIAYMWRAPGRHWRVFIVGANGGQARELAVGARAAIVPSWSADGTRIAFSGQPQDGRQDEPVRLYIVNLRDGRLSTVPGSDGLFAPAWSHDGRMLAALSTDSRRLALFDFASSRWRDLVRGAAIVGWHYWTRDSTHIQVQQGPTIVRFRVRDGQVTPVASVEGLAQVAQPPIGPWLGINADDEPLALREVTFGQEVYALHVGRQ